jgi:hypothetical protein
MELTDLPDRSVHVAGFGREDLGVLEINVVIMVRPMFCHRQFLCMPKPNVALMLFYSGLNRVTVLSDINVATVEGDAVHTRTP